LLFFEGIFIIPFLLILKPAFIGILGFITLYILVVVLDKKGFFKLIKFSQKTVPQKISQPICVLSVFCSLTIAILIANNVLK
jgi:hypothetical protein